MEGVWLLMEESYRPYIKILPYNLWMEVWCSKHLQCQTFPLLTDLEGCFYMGSQRKPHKYLSFRSCLNVPDCVHTGFLKIACLLQWWKDTQAPNDEPVVLLYLSKYLQEGIGTFSSCLMPKWCREVQPRSGNRPSWLQSLTSIILIYTNN